MTLPKLKSARSVQDLAALGDEELRQARRFSFGVITDVQYADIPDGQSFHGVPRYAPACWHAGASRPQAPPPARRPRPARSPRRPRPPRAGSTATAWWR
jgi:hypothetical protein